MIIDKLKTLNLNHMDDLIKLVNHTQLKDFDNVFYMNYNECYFTKKITNRFSLDVNVIYPFINFYTSFDNIKTFENQFAIGNQYNPYIIFDEKINDIKKGLKK